VAPAFAASADFAIDKAAGRPCPNLAADLRCGIHAQLRERGFAGCTAYDCFGAGQRVTQETFGGLDWRDAPHEAPRMFAALPVVRQLHELLWLLEDALERSAAAPVHPGLEVARQRVERLAGSGPDELASLDVAGERAPVGRLLARASELVRAASAPGRRPRDRARADLAGADLRGADLRAASLRGALLVGARLRGADLRAADLLGADLRGADLRGADLRDALFLTRTQVDSARGDAQTLLPAALDRPTHWLEEA
jgi:hypothetical protein